MPHGKTSTLLVHTPEGIVFSLTLAGPVTRFLAWGVDMACIGALSSALGTLLGLLASRLMRPLQAQVFTAPSPRYAV